MTHLEFLESLQEDLRKIYEALVSGNYTDIALRTGFLMAVTESKIAALKIEDNQLHGN